MPRTRDPHAKSKLLTAAEAAFVRSGLDGAKVEEIARSAGLSKGAFYLHFDGKDDAFRQLIEAMVARLATFIDDCPVDSARQMPNVDEFLEFWVVQDAAIFDFVWQNRGLVGLLLEGGRSAAYRHLVDEFADRASGKTRLLLQAGVKAGLYRPDLDLDVTCAFIGGAYDRLARKIVRERRKPDLHALIRQVQILFLRGIASPALMVALDAKRPSNGVERSAAPPRGASAEGMGTPPRVPILIDTQRGSAARSERGGHGNPSEGSHLEKIAVPANRDRPQRS
jgi:AcrR family transcriptional regulator